MGRIHCRRSELVGTVSELVGHKTGLALTHSEFAELLPAEDYPVWHGDFDHGVSIRAEELEQMFAHLLHRLGSVSSPSTVSPTMMLFAKYRDAPAKQKIAQDVTSGWLKDIRALMEFGPPAPGTSYDPTNLFNAMQAKHGSDGARMVLEFVEALDESFHRSPWSQVRRVEWQNEEELSSLFSSPSERAKHGKFFDQRYIDYLVQNFNKLGEIHWRNFEALTCEYYDRQGYHVEIGPGTNDDGVDARVWERSDDSSLAPTLIIQCKREKTKIKKVVVKGLYADVLHERATAGLIVTSGSLSEGAKKTLVTRRYPIRVAERAEILKWLEKMRTPGRGVFLAE